VANDQKTFGDRYVEAIRAWAAAHPGVTLDQIAGVLDSAPDAEAVARFLADPEKRTPSAPTE